MIIIIIDCVYFMQIQNIACFVLFFLQFDSFSHLNPLVCAFYLQFCVWRIFYKWMYFFNKIWVIEREMKGILFLWSEHCIRTILILFHWITNLLHHVAQVYSLCQLGALLHAVQKCMLSYNRKKNKVLAPAPFLFLYILINVLILILFYYYFFLLLCT